jgi:hypothetical protein
MHLASEPYICESQVWFKIKSSGSINKQITFLSKTFRALLAKAIKELSKTKENLPAIYTFLKNPWRTYAPPMQMNYRLQNSEKELTTQKFQNQYKANSFN